MPVSQTSVLPYCRTLGKNSQRQLPASFLSFVDSFYNVLFSLVLLWTFPLSLPPPHRRLRTVQHQRYHVLHLFRPNLSVLHDCVFFSSEQEAMEWCNTAVIFSTTSKTTFGRTLP